MSALQPTANILALISKHYDISKSEAETVLALPEFPAAVPAKVGGAKIYLYRWSEVIRFLEAYDQTGERLATPVTVDPHLQIAPDVRYTKTGGKQKTVNVSAGKRPPYSDVTAYRAWRAAQKARKAAEAKAKAEQRPNRRVRA